MEKFTILIFLIAQSIEIFGIPLASMRFAPEEAGHFEGDMILDLGQLQNVEARAGLTGERHRWVRNQNGTVIVPYTFRDGSPYTSIDLQRIQSAMHEIQNKTCIRFMKRKNEVDYIEIFSGNGCFSSVGRIRGRQNLSLMRFGCLSNGIIIHELLHALGFFHMQSSFDRDNYVRINYENIEKGRENNFQKYSKFLVSHFGTSYDFDSVMHYRRNAFSRNGKDTIETQNVKNINRIGQRVKMSVGDVKRVKNMYCVS